jgi:hypothetical protein
MLNGGHPSGSQAPISQAIRSLLNGDAARRVPLDLRTQLAPIGVGSGDRIIIDGLPPGASLSAGQCKAGRSWTVLPHEMDEVAFLAAETNGATHTLEIFVLTPDPIDCDLAKTKGSLQISVTDPVAEREPEEQAAAVNGLSPVDLADNVIRLPGDAPQQLPQMPPEVEASDEVRIAVEQYIAAAQAEWRAETARQVAAAEARIRIKHQEQLSLIEGLLSTEETTRAAALEEKWRTEVERQVAATEARLTARHKEQIAALEARWRVKQAGRPGRDSGPAVDIDGLLDEARQRWKVEQAEALAAVRAEWAAAAERRLVDARAEWQIGEARRSAAEREAWQVEEVARRSAIEAEWRAELERQVAAVENRIAARHQQELAAAEARWREEASHRETQVDTASTGAAAAAIEAKLRAEYADKLAAAEAKLAQQYQERLAALEAAWQVKFKERVAAIESQWADRLRQQEAALKAAAGPELQGKIDEALAAARATWHSEEAERLAAAKASWDAAEAVRRAQAEAEALAATQQQIAAVESQLSALYDMRMAAAEVAWRRGDGDRLAAAEAAWRRTEAERMAAAEAKWRAEYDRRMEIVLTNAVAMIKGQLGSAAANHLPAIAPTMPAPAPAHDAAKDEQPSAASPVAPEEMISDKVFRIAAA